MKTTARLCLIVLLIALAFALPAPAGADVCPSVASTAGIDPVPTATPEPCTPPPSLPGYRAYLPVVARPGIVSVPATTVFPGP